MPAKEWIVLEEIDVPNSDDQLVVSYWPHEEGIGGNHEGEHWVHVNHNTGNYRVTRENHYFWNKNARYRAYNHLRKMMERRDMDPPSGIPSFKEIPSAGYELELFEMEEFLDLVERKVLVEYDGYGKYANENYVSHIKVNPSQSIDESWSHVVWYNRLYL